MFSARTTRLLFLTHNQRPAASVGDSRCGLFFLDARRKTPTLSPPEQPANLPSPALGRGVSGSLAKILALVVRGLMLTPTQKSYPKHADGQ